MKFRKTTLNLLSLIAIFSFSYIISSCSNNDSSDTNTNEQQLTNYRLSELLFKESWDSEIEEVKHIISYTEDKISEFLSFEHESGVWTEKSKTILIYQGDWVYLNYYYKEGNNWIEINDESFKIRIVNEKVIETEFSYQDTIDRTIFYYNGDNLIKIEEYENEELYWFDEYDYIGDKVQESRQYHISDGESYIDEKTEFTYDGENLIETLQFNWHENEWVPNRKENYSYSGNQVIQINVLNWNGNTWELSSNSQFTYNNDGLLIFYKSDSNDSTNYYEGHITYESGKGNIKYIMGDIYYEAFNKNSPYLTIQKFSNIKKNKKKIIIHKN